MPKRKKINWPAESKYSGRIQERVKRLSEERHKAIREYQKLKLQEAKEVAKLITVRPSVRKEEMKRLVTNFLEGTLKERKRLGLKTGALERALANPNKTVDRIMRLQDAKYARADQRWHAISGGLFAVSSGALITTGALEHNWTTKAGGYAAAAGAGWQLADYKYKRKEIHDRIDELRRKREKLADRLIEH